jgi:hypothetical protein
MDFDDSVIPKGYFCYTVVWYGEGESEVPLTNRFGFEVREARTHERAKRVLCPHWQRTTHGTVRCERMEREAAFDTDYQKNVALAIAHFGSKEAWESIRASPYDLGDEQKICGINVDDDDDEYEEM